MAKKKTRAGKPDPDKGLFWKRECGWGKIAAKERQAVEGFCRGYMEFLCTAKTEREFHDRAAALAAQAGFVPLEGLPETGNGLKPGVKVMCTFGGRTVFLFTIGRRPLTDGMRLVGGHIDSPRLDAKPNPVYEDSGMVFLDTRYYGGIKKYQWVTLPLALHGVVTREDGSQATVTIGEDPGDPVFVITDLLPHLGAEQMKGTLADGIKGEALNVLAGSLPVDDKKTKESNKVKLNIMRWLRQKYRISEEDLISADLELVPAGPARELGFDRSMILAYGHDDRVCSYAAMRAIFDLKTIPEYTAGVILCDKEEIGSVGATGMESTIFENAVAELLRRTPGGGSELDLRRCLQCSKMLSADVNALHDPNYGDVSSPNNMAQLNAGLVLTKYTGGRGKGHSSEASPEFMAFMRRVFNENKVLWQTGELGKVDAGGGGTIAMFMARYGMEVVDCGVGLLSMHAPWETAGKLDIYMAWKGYRAFLAHSRSS